MSMLTLVVSSLSQNLMFTNQGLWFSTAQLWCICNEYCDIFFALTEPWISQDRISGQIVSTQDKSYASVGPFYDNVK